MRAYGIALRLRIGVVLIIFIQGRTESIVYSPPSFFYSIPRRPPEVKNDLKAPRIDDQPPRYVTAGADRER